MQDARRMSARDSVGVRGSRRRQLLAAVGCVVALGVPGASEPAHAEGDPLPQAPWEITELSFNPHAINDRGEIAGMKFSSGRARACLFAAGEVIDLGTLGGSTSSARGLNGRGDVVGDADTKSDRPADTRAFLYSGGAMVDIGTLGGTFSSAWAVNDSRQIVGYAYTAANQDVHAFLYSGGAMTDLGTLGEEFAMSQALAVNESGQVVGWSHAGPDYVFRAFLYSGGAMKDLGTLGGLQSGADGINESGQVVGWSTTPSGPAHAFLYSGGAMKDLGTLGGPDRSSEAYAINDSGQVVGRSDPASGFGSRAFLYTGGKMVDLNTLLAPGSPWLLERATAINSSGWIIGSGKRSGVGRTFLLKPAETTPPPDLSVTDVKVAQVVYDPDINDDGVIDLVAGKPAVITFTVESTVTDLDDDTLVTLEARLDGQVADTRTVRLGALRGPHWALKFTPFVSGWGTVSVTVDTTGAVAESDETNNHVAVSFDVKPTRDLNVAYFAAYSDQLGSTREFEFTVARNNAIISATFPVAHYNGAPQSAQFELKSDGGIPKHLLEFGAWGQLVGTEKAVGVVPIGYFAAHGREGTTGVSVCGTNSGLVEEGFIKTAAHELGHMFGLRCDAGGGEEYKVNEDDEIIYAGNPATGYWVDAEVPITEAICFMGATRGGRDDSLLDEPPFAWVDMDDYVALFREFLLDPVDPEALVVSALLHRNGTAELGRWYYMPNTMLAPATPGNCVVKVMDASGAVLATCNAEVDFIMMVEPTGPEATDFHPLVVKVAFPGTAVSVQIELDGQVIATVPAASKTLLDAIDAIPDHGFTKLPTQRRNALRNKAEAVEKMVQAGSSTGAVKKLSRDLRETVELWLRDGYVKATPVQLEKLEVLRVIDEMTKRLTQQ